MAEEKPTLEGQTGTAVAEPEVVELTEQELAHRLDTDAEFATAYLNGDVEVEPISSEPAAPAPETGVAAAPAAAPQTPPAPKTPAPDADKGAVTPTDDGKFEVEFEDGSKLSYKSKPEALKAIREKENYIRRAKAMLRESTARENELAAKIAELEKKSASAPAAAAAPVPPKTETKLEEKAHEVLDPFDPDYQKKLAEKGQALEQLVLQFKTQYEADRKADKEEKVRREAETVETEKRQSILKSSYGEANLFVSRHPEFKLDKPVEVMDEAYRGFLKELGELAGTDGSIRQNVAMMDLYQDPNSEHGKKLKAEADKIGLRPPENLENYFNVLFINDQRKKLNKTDDVSGKLVPFTMEETYRYLQMQNGAPAPVAAAPVVPPPENKNTVLSPRAQAIVAAEEHKRSVATDLSPASSGQPVDVSQMSVAQISQIMDWDPKEVRRDPHKRAVYDAVFKYMKVAPVRLDG